MRRHLDNLVGREGDWRNLRRWVGPIEGVGVGVIGRVELRARREVAGGTALIVALARRVDGGVEGALAGLNDLVLQARGERHDTLLGAVLLCGERVPFEVGV